MLFKFVIACAVAALLVQDSEALLINRFGLGFGGFGPFGGFGFPGIGFGGFPFGGLGFGGLGFGGIGRFGFGRRFGREANANVTECTIASESSTLMCSGVNTFTCDISQNFTGLGPFAFVVKDLVLSKVEDKSEMPVYHFLAEKEVDHKIVTDKHTFINPADNKPIILSVYESEKINDLGFRFKDMSCWEKFTKMVKDTKEKDIDFELFISQAH